jgi:hypothetical protein
MTSLKTLAAAALLSAMTATPVFAQAAIQEPGLFAFYHPNLDVLNGGAPTPEIAPAGIAASDDLLVRHPRLARGHGPRSNDSRNADTISRCLFHRCAG